MEVARYTQQAVLMANVEEAHYRVLLTKDGKSLVEARYAVRNNQRNFLKIALPPGATLWSASLSDNPVRPGLAPDSALLLPLAKARSGEDAPEFAVEVIYFAPSSAWTDKGRWKLSLPAVYLQISRTGLQLFYPPFYKVSAEAGAFHVDTYDNPHSAVLTSFASEPPIDAQLAPQAGSVSALLQSSPGVAAPAETANDRLDRKKQEARDSSQTLVDKFHASEGGTRASGILPLRVTVPSFGPSLFLVSQLTSENQFPAADFSYQQEKKAGGK